MIYHLKRVAKWRLDTGNKLLKNLGRSSFESFTRPFGEISIHGKNTQRFLRCEERPEKEVVMNVEHFLL